MILAPFRLYYSRFLDRTSAENDFSVWQIRWFLQGHYFSILDLIHCWMKNSRTELYSALKRKISNNFCLFSSCSCIHRCAILDKSLYDLSGCKWKKTCFCTKTTFVCAKREPLSQKNLQMKPYLKMASGSFSLLSPRLYWRKICYLCS